MFRWIVCHKGGPGSAPSRVAVTVGDKVYCFGEFNDVGQIDVQVFNTVALRWQRLPPVTIGREGCSPNVNICDKYTAVLIEGLVYMWGGNNIQNPLCVFDVDAHRCFRPEASGTAPEPRCCHSKTIQIPKLFQVSIAVNDVLEK